MAADLLNTVAVQSASRSPEESRYAESRAKKRPRVQKPEQPEEADELDSGEQKHQLDLDA